MSTAPKGLRPHIALFGRRNAGKSSLLNLLAGQEVSIVAPAPGTTTDPVEKAMEFIPLGPVQWIDTAGIDDEGELGALRSARAKAVMDRTDLALIVFAQAWGAWEQSLYDDFAGRGVPVVAVASKADLRSPADAFGALPAGLHPVPVCAPRGEGLGRLRQAIVAAMPAEFVEAPVIVRDLAPPGSCVLLVTPIDSEAPKGRLILPQVQALRDCLDGDCYAVVVKETGIAPALAGLARPPVLAVTDSQAFGPVAAALPADIPLTGFSVLFARAKGDLASFARGAAAISRLRSGDTVLVAESCTHHSGGDDIGRVKIPNLLRKKTGADLHFRHVQGHDFPADLSGVGLVLHCGACMTNRRAVLSRQAACAAAGVPMTNYGLAIAYCQGLLERALAPFPAALAQYAAVAQ